MSLDINHVSYRVNGCLILDDVTATGDVGEIIGLIGPNGAGKSTLANVFNGLVLPSKGAVHFNGRNLVGVPPEKIGRLGVARTFQGQHLPWNSTPYECLLSVLTSDPKRVYSPTGEHDTGAATFRNPGEQAEAFVANFGLEEVSSAPARDLSFGQQRLLALAMACARSSKLLILDEPFAGLKSGALQLVLDVLRAEAKTKLLIVIDHTLSAVRAIASRIWFMHRGRLTNFRDYSEMAASEAFLGHYLGRSQGEPPTEHKQPSKAGLSSRSHQRPVASPSPVLVLDKVSAGYGNKVVVRRTSLEVLPGEVVSIIGMNGSGKSTVLRAIAGIAHLFEGDVYLCGERLDRLPSDKRMRMGVRLLVEDHRLFRTLTPADNLLLSAAALVPTAARAIVAPYFAADRAAKDSVANMQRMLESDGLAFTDRPAGTYSGGEQARVALAQLDFGTPQLILLDEPTSGIDGIATKALVSAIRDWQRRQIPVVIVEHALDFVASISTRVLVMARGELHRVETSAPDSSQLMEEIFRRA